MGKIIIESKEQRVKIQIRLTLKDGNEFVAAAEKELEKYANGSIEDRGSALDDFRYCIIEIEPIREMEFSEFLARYSKEHDLVISYE